MDKIDRIDNRGNIRAHYTLDGGLTTLCGLTIGDSQRACNAFCKRCVAIQKRRQREARLAVETALKFAGREGC